MKADDMHTETLPCALPLQCKISLSSLWERFDLPFLPHKVSTGRDGDSQPKRSVCAQCPGGVSFAAIETEYFLPSGLFVHEKFFFFHFYTTSWYLKTSQNSPLPHLPWKGRTPALQARFCRPKIQSEECWGKIVCSIISTTTPSEHHWE